jgi:hypothetical protein
MSNSVIQSVLISSLLKTATQLYEFCFSSLSKIVFTRVEVTNWIYLNKLNALIYKIKPYLRKKIDWKVVYIHTE